MPHYLPLIAALLYLVLPYDLLPDMFGLPGRIDDLLVLGFVLWRGWQQRRSTAGKETRPGTDAGAATTSHTEQPRLPHLVLGVGEEATVEEIERRYRELMKQYHPDRVHGLGPELQEVAHRRTIEIQQAYDSLKQRRKPNE